MNAEKLSNWLQVVGAGGIIASLVFVGFQLKQSQDIAIAGQYQARYESAMETFRAMLQSEFVLKMMGTKSANAILGHPEVPDEIKTWVREQPAEELWADFLLAGMDLKTADNLFFQYRSGFLSEEAWQSHRASLKIAFALPFPTSTHRFMYENFSRKSFSASFQNLCDDLLAEIDAESGQQAAGIVTD